MRRTRILPLVLLPLTLAACSSSDDPAGLEDGEGTLTAIVDGAPWNAQIRVATNNGFLFSLQGEANGIEISLSADQTRNTLPGTVDLTAGSTGAQLVEGSESWYAVGEGGGGTMTLEILTPSRAKGTFQFNAGPVANSASGGVRTIIDGQFDVTF